MKKRKVLIIDTSILCVWLEVPTKKECKDWDKELVDELIKEEIKQNSILVLPLATIIETGNHIAHSKGNIFELAEKLSKLMIEAADETSPWAAFTEQSHLWSAEGLKKLAEEFPNFAVQQLAIGDITIKIIAEFYNEMGYMVEIATGDEQLKPYEQKSLPRRRNQS